MKITLLPIARVVLFWGVFSCALLNAQEVPADTEQKNGSTMQEEEKNKDAQPQAESSRKQDDFKPREEISEDYPVPLPADI